MPLKQAVERIQTEQWAYDEWEERYWRKQATWELKFVVWPRRCALSRRWLWLKRAYRGEYQIHGPGDPVVDVRWQHPHQHLIWLLET